MITNDILSDSHKYIMNTYSRQPLVLVKGRGTKVYDSDGREYLDFVTGVAVCNLGHCHPRWSAALAEQAATLGFYSNVVYSPVRARAARALLDLAGGRYGRVFYCNSGTEANETALKLARKATGRQVVVGRYVHMVDSYHIYGSYFTEFEGRFIGGLSRRNFEQRTIRYEDVRDIMEEARPMILEKAQTMGKV